MKPNETTVAWPREKCHLRVRFCLAFLHIHGFLSDAEREKVARRILKWRKKEARA